MSDLTKENEDLPECLAPEWLGSTGEFTCSYDKCRTECLLVAIPSPGTRIGKQCATLLSSFGFRRSGVNLYRPHCPGCDKCISVRLRVDDFKPNRTFNKYLKKNADLSMTVTAPANTAEYLQLLKTYLSVRHKSDEEEEETTKDDFQKYYVNTVGETEFFEYRDKSGKLVMVSITDIFSDGFSAVYTFYDPAEMKRSPGTYAILRQIEETKKRGLPYLYLGFWIDDVPNMSYKTKFQPLEVFVQEQWKEFQDCNDSYLNQEKEDYELPL